jgi:hypothetical protein
MKVDTKIVPIEVKDGWFKKKTKYQLQWVITLTEVEKAIINKAGLRDFSYYDHEYTSPDGSFRDVQPFPIYPWIDGTTRDFGHGEYNTLIEAQAVAQKIKQGLTALKQAMDAHTSTPTEDSFEL